MNLCRARQGFDFNDLACHYNERKKQTNLRLRILIQNTLFQGDIMVSWLTTTRDNDFNTGKF